LSQEIIDGDRDGKEPLPDYLEKATILFAGTALWEQDANGDAGYQLVSVQAYEHVATHEVSGERADSRRQSTINPSTGEYGGRGSNEMLPEEPVRGPRGSSSDARLPSPSTEYAHIRSSPRLGPWRV